MSQPQEEVSPKEKFTLWRGETEDETPKTCKPQADVDRKEQFTLRES